MSEMGISEKVAASAEFGLRFAAEKECLHLPGDSALRVAKTVAIHTISGAINSGEVISKDKHAVEIEHLTRRAKQFENAWAGARVEADAQLQRVQCALSGMTDRVLAAGLAEQIGVMLLEPAE